MKNKKGYLLLETVISSFIVITISISLYSLLLYSSKYKTSVEDRVELYEQGEEMCFQINKTIENSDGIISIRDLNGNTIKEFESISAAAQELNCHYQAISQCASGKIKTCCGYRWKYLNK